MKAGMHSISRSTEDEIWEFLKVGWMQQQKNVAYSPDNFFQPLNDSDDKWVVLETVRWKRCWYSNCGAKQNRTCNNQFDSRGRIDNVMGRVLWPVWLKFIALRRWQSSSSSQWRHVVTWTTGVGLQIYRREAVSRSAAAKMTSVSRSPERNTSIHQHRRVMLQTFCL